jgi:hypothetical protein
MLTKHLRQSNNLKLTHTFQFRAELLKAIYFSKDSPHVKCLKTSPLSSSLHNNFKRAFLPPGYPE